MNLFVLFGSGPIARKKNDGIFASCTTRNDDDWLIVYYFTSRSRIFHLYGDVTITGEGLQNLGLCPLSREGSLSCHTCCDTGPRFFRSHPKDRHNQSPLTTRMGMRKAYSNPDPHGDCAMKLSQIRLRIELCMREKFTFLLQALLIFVFLINNYQQFLYNMANNYHLLSSSPWDSREDLG